MRWDRSLIFFFCVVGAALALPGVGGAAPEGPALRLVAPAADLRGAPLQVDATGSWVRFSFAPQDGAPALFALGERALRLGPRPDSRLRPPGRVPPPAGLPGACCAVAAGPGEIAVAAADGLRLIGGDGAVRWSAPLPAAATDLNASGDGRLLVAALADGTLRWHAAQDGRLLLSWFPFRDRRRWVAWTPSG